MESAYYVIENHLPVYTWPLLLLIFLISLGACARREKGNRISSILHSLLITYIAAILFTTLIFRTPAVSADGVYIHKAEWLPLWSWYEVIVNHSSYLFSEILLNVVLFMPVGVLLALLRKDKPESRLRPTRVFLIGFTFSAFIETMQFVTCRGLFEWDDMLHNGLGCLIGYCAGRVVLRVRKLSDKAPDKGTAAPELQGDQTDDGAPSE